MFAAPCRAPTMLVGRYHRSRLPPLLMLMRPADLYVIPWSAELAHLRLLSTHRWK
jgi:hypothetical protein